MHWRSVCPCLRTKSHSTSTGSSMNPVLRVTEGLLQGVVCKDSTLGVEYVAFKGVPYAKPPLGNLRFKDPKPPEPWQGIRDASRHGPVCPQYNERMQRIDPGSEDCLYLNVYTKNIQPDQPLPVMVWIHGGGFYTGSGDSDFYGPEFFMEQDIILVTFNYRLEVLGFLCLENEDVPGNAGLKDQVAALKWVKNNIAAFGGNNNNITIFGCSAGSASVSFHLISKMSQGLFNNAICQSGVCLNDWAYCLYPKERAFQLGKLLGKETDDRVELLHFLRNVPTKSLINVQLPLLKTKKMDLADMLTFGPVIEKPKLKVEKFMSKPPHELVTKGQIANVPIIVGYTSGEGLEIARKLDRIIGFLSLVGAIVPRELKLKWITEKITNADKKIRNYYFKDKELTKEMTSDVANLTTDSFFAYNTQRFARYIARNNSKPVYLYKFTAETERNYTKRSYKVESLPGACHSDDLMYLFNVTNLEIPLSNESRNIIKQFVQLWTSFAGTGNPTLSNDSEQWKPFTETEQNCFIIGKGLKCVRNQDAENMKFWDEIYGEINDLQKA